MRPGIEVLQAGPSEAERVGRLACGLLTELYPDVEYLEGDFTDSARALLGAGEGVWAFLATASGDRDVGLITLNECAAIYAGGRFGEISELYVVPDYRSRSVGARLIEKAISFGHQRGWRDIEVGAPNPPEWQRTVDFYMRRGFEEIGPRLNLELSSVAQKPNPSSPG